MMPGGSGLIVISLAMKIKMPLSQLFTSKLLTLNFTESTWAISEELRERGQVCLGPMD